MRIYLAANIDEPYRTAIIVAFTEQEALKFAQDYLKGRWKITAEHQIYAGQTILVTE